MRQQKQLKSLIIIDMLVDQNGARSRARQVYLLLFCLGSVFIGENLPAQAIRRASLDKLRQVRLEKLFEVQVGGGTAQAIAISPKGDIIASGGPEGDLMLWNRKSGKPIWTRNAHEHWIGAIAFSPDGKILAVADLHKVVLYKFKR